jgi:hypothetical protein
MHRLLIAVPLATIALLLAGCAPKPEPVVIPPAVPATDDSVRLLRDALNQQASGTEVAAVTEVLGEELVLQASATTESFPQDAIVSVLDTNGLLLAHGKVARGLARGVMIRYTVVGPRPPAVGDVVVRLPVR